jgi:hypothetical protein
MVWEVEEYSTAVGHFFLRLGTEVFERCTLKMSFCIVYGLLEERSQLDGLVASVQESVEEELEFLHDVPFVRAELMDTENVTKDQTGEDTGGMAGVWREVEVKCHWFGVEGGLDLPSLNRQAEIHEYHFL